VYNVIDPHCLWPQCRSLYPQEWLHRQVCIITLTRAVDWIVVLVHLLVYRSNSNLEQCYNAWAFVIEAPSVPEEDKIGKASNLCWSCVDWDSHRFAAVAFQHVDNPIPQDLVIKLHGMFSRRLHIHCNGCIPEERTTSNVPKLFHIILSDNIVLSARYVPLNLLLA